MSPALACGFFTTGVTWEATYSNSKIQNTLWEKKNNFKINKMRKKIRIQVSKFSKDLRNYV